MKPLEIIFIVVLSVSLTLGAIWANNKYHETPTTKIQALAQDVTDMIAKANTGGLDKIYEMQLKAKIPGAERQIAIVVPERLLKPPVKPVVKTTAGNTPPKKS